MDGAIVDSDNVMSSKSHQMCGYGISVNELDVFCSCVSNLKMIILVN